MTRKRIFTTLVALGATALGIYAWQQNAIQNPNREHPMTEPTKNMKTVCFGRYLVDIPAQADFSSGHALFDEIKVEFVGPSPTDRVFMDKVKRRETELRALKHDTEGTRLREAVDINGGKQRLFVYREDADDVRLSWIETTVRSGTFEWEIRNDSSEEYVAETKTMVTKLATKLQHRNTQDIPTTPGACIENGLVTGSDFQTEEFPLGFSLKAHATTFGISSVTAGIPETRQTLWARVANADKLTEEFFNAASKTNKVLRHAEVVVDGRKGQEHINTWQDQDNGTEIFNADAEIYGDGTPKLPGFQISMTVNRPLKPDPNSKEKPLTNAEALALWDVMLKSIRPRPGAF